MTLLEIPTEQNFWTITETYSFVQGTILALYAFIVLKRFFLGSLLLVISILIFSHLFNLYGWFFTIPHSIFIEAPLWYVVGPLFLFFTSDLYGKKFHKRNLIHLIPFLVVIGYFFPFYIEDAQVKIEVFTTLYSEASFQSDWNRYLFSTHILAYILMSYLMFRKEEWNRKQASAETNLIFSDLASIALRYYLIFAFLGLLIYPFIATNLSLTLHYYHIYYVGLSLIIHLTFFYAIFTPSKTDKSDVGKFQKKYSSSSLQKDEMEKIVGRVVTYVQQYEVYKNPDLRLRMVADELGIPMHHISQSVNQVSNQTFFDLINEIRINGLKTNFNNPKFQHYTLTGIASEHGFKSSSSFYRIFKKYTGKTPKEYFDQ